MSDQIMSEDHSELAERIEGALAQIRPYLEADLGDITLKEITDDLIGRTSRIMRGMLSY
jgi:Fe-S cluster biogenesis protein NfuA